MTTPRLISILVPLCLTVNASCDEGSDPGGSAGFDVEDDCAKTIHCAEQTLGPAPDDQQGLCVADTDDWLAEAEPAMVSDANDAYDSCGHLASCEYVDCFITEFAPPGVTPSECPDAPDVTEGEVATADAVIPYRNAEVLFWKPLEAGCITGVDVKLNSGNCGFDFSAHDLVDSDGRFLITNVSFDANGLCPGYPEGLDGLYTEFADDKPLGTIEIIRPEEDWNVCAATTVIVRPDVLLEDFFADTAIDLRGSEIELSGDFTWTHFNTDPECPEVF